MVRETVVTNRLKSFFKKNKSIEMAFLFGSVAEGRAIRESDVDVAVWFKGKYDLKTVNALESEITSLLGRNVDLIVLNQARPTIAWAAMRGIKLLIRNYPLFIRQMLAVSDEAEFMQDFVIDLFNQREKYRLGRAKA
ncbi:MAG: nucleotidyltransferase domain-containing protein [bacterium]